jgi:hypothetical protein
MLGYTLTGMIPQVAGQVDSGLMAFQTMKWGC